MKEQLETKVLRLADALHDVDMAAGSKTARKASRAIVNYRDTVNLCNHVWIEFKRILHESI